MDEQVEAVRSGLEKFTQEVDLEYYLTGAGLKEEAEFTKIFQKYGRLFTRDSIRLIQDHLEKTRDPEDARKLGFLRAFIVGDYLENHVKELSDKFLTLESQATVQVDGETLPFRQSSVILANEADRTRREKIFHARNRVIDKLSELLADRMRTLHRVSRELGYENYTRLYEGLKGFDLSNLESLLQPFMHATGKLYRDRMSILIQEKAGVQLAHAEKHDTSYAFRAKEYDHYFSSARAIPTLAKTLAGLGINLRAQPNIHLDTQDRPKKTPRPFVSPIDVPRDIRLVVMPQGGHDDYAALLHEAGHAEHYGSMNPELPMEYRYLGDNSLTEGWAFLMEYLMQNEQWLKAYTTMSNPDDYLSFVNLYKLYFLRRYTAKLSYEIELHTKGLDGSPENYQRTMEHALAVKHPPSHYLIDVDDGFYCANYLRAWVFESQVRRLLLRDFGDRWFERKEAGRQLLEWWSQGQKYTAEEFLKGQGFKKGLDASSLTREFQ